jgi:O-antigen ligase
VVFAAADLLPPLAGVLVEGRSGPVTATAITTTSLALRLQSVAWLVLIGVALVIVVLGLASQPDGVPRPDATGVVLLLGVLAIAQLSGWLGTGEYSPSRPVLVLLLAAAAVSVSAPQAEVFSLVGRITAAVAVVSVVLALVSPDAWMDPARTEGDTKAILGSRLLAGFLGHENTLGIILAAGFPFVLDAFRGGARLCLALVTVVALVLTSSRTSLAALAVVLAAVLATRLLGRRAARPLLVAGAFGLLLLTVALPATAGDSAFTERGAIWRLAAPAWTTDRLFGLGPYAFSRGTPLSSDLLRMLGYPVVHGHSTYVSTRTEVGWVGLVLLGLLLVRVLLKSARMFDDRPAPLLFVLALLALGTLETPLRLDTVADQAWLTWGVVIVLACYPLRAHTGSADRGTLA